MTTRIQVYRPSWPILSPLVAFRIRWFLATPPPMCARYDPREHDGQKSGSTINMSRMRAPCLGSRSHLRSMQRSDQPPGTRRDAGHANRVVDHLPFAIDYGTRGELGRHDQRPDS